MNRKCCFTGHRPQKLPWGFDEQDKRCLVFKRKINLEIEKAIQNGYDYFISGMALGCDIYFSESVLLLKQQYPYIQLECAIPYEEQTSRWNNLQRQRYYEIMEKCDKETMLSHHYYRGCFMDRNKYMVDKSNLLIAAYIETEKGGTYNTITYAKRQGKQIVSIPICSSIFVI